MNGEPTDARRHEVRESAEPAPAPRRPRAPVPRPYVPTLPKETRELIELLDDRGEVYRLP